MRLHSPPLRVQLPGTLAGAVAVARAAGPADLEQLRSWKNAHRAAFFHQDEITPAQQAAWFDAFSRREDAALFVLDLDGRPVACVGFRATGPATLELFNLILGDTSLARLGVMSAFYEAVEGELARRGARRLHLVVLESNAAARSFYARHGYAPTTGPAPRGACAMAKELA